MLHLLKLLPSNNRKEESHSPGDAVSFSLLTIPSPRVPLCATHGRAGSSPTHGAGSPSHLPATKPDLSQQTRQLPLFIPEVTPRISQDGSTKKMHGQRLKDRAGA